LLDLFVLATLLFQSCVGGYRQGHSKPDQNPDEHDFLEERGSARLGWSRGASGPLATLFADRNVLRLSFAGDNIVFTKDRIVALRMSRRLLSGSLCVEHDLPIYSRSVKFTSH